MKRSIEVSILERLADIEIEREKHEREIDRLDHEASELGKQLAAKEPHNAQ